MQDLKKKQKDVQNLFKYHRTHQLRDDAYLFETDDIRMWQFSQDVELFDQHLVNLLVFLAYNLDKS